MKNKLPFPCFTHLNHLLSVLLMLLLIIPFILLSSSPISAAENSSQRVVRVGWFTLDGYQYIDQDGNHSGYGYEYYQEIAKYTGWRYEYVSGSWQECLSMLEKGEIDIMSFLQYTEKRDQIYDFTTESIGSNYGQLTALTTNDRFALDNYRTFDDITVGVLRGATQIEQLRDFADQNHFDYTLKVYDEINQMTSALESGEIDALLNHNFRRLTASEKIIAKFSPNTMFCSVKKGNTALLTELNNALSEIQMNYPTLNSRLMEKYFSVNAPKGLILSKDEKLYLKTLEPLRVVASPFRKPLSYFENGEFKGIHREIMDQLASILGLEFIYVETDSYQKSLSMISSGEADILCDYFTDYSWAEQNNVFITSPYMSLQYSHIQRKTTLPKHVTVAAVKSFKFSKDYVQTHFPPEDITWYDTPIQCLDAVNTGKQDVTFPNTYLANDHLRSRRYSNLMANAIPYSHDISLATSMHLPQILNTVLDKALISLGKEQIQSITAKHTLFLPFESNLLSYLYRNPLESISILALLSLTVMILLSIIIRNKNKHNKDMLRMLYIDDITDYPNYKCFQLKASKLLLESTDSPYALLYTDIQKFKYINDTFGHAKGDALLKELTNLIHSFMEESELFSRIYADHFVILLHYKDREQLKERVQILLDTICSKAENWKKHYNVLLKTGIYLLHPDERSIEKAVDSASYAKDTIQNFFSNTFVFYDEAMRTQIQKDKFLEQGMNSALENHEFEAYFQARVNINNYRIVGAEALVRWNHPQEGLLFPDQFIPFFERNGFITKLDIAIFEQACLRLSQMKENGTELLPISCNFSRLHLNDLTLPDQLLEITRKYEVPTNMLEVELTETIATDNFEMAVILANKLRDYGFLISIDDFGSGYSSIQLLYRLPLNVLKLDKIYVQNESSGSIENEVVKSLIQISHSNGIYVVCEGVENSEQEQYVRDHNCRFVQGYLYSKPIPYDAFINLIKTTNDAEKIPVNE